VRGNVKQVVAIVLFVAVGTVLWVEALLLLLVAVDLFSGFHPEVLVHRVQEAGGTAYYPAPLLVALTVFLLGLTALRTRKARRLFYVAAGWAVVAVLVGFLGLLVSATLHCPLQCKSACSGRVRLCENPSIAAPFLPPSVAVGAGECECWPLVISPARALIGMA